MVRGGMLVVLVLVIFTIINSSFVYAELNDTEDLSQPSVLNNQPAGGFDASKSYNWLYEKVSNASFDTDKRALSDIALIQGNFPNVAGLLEALRDKEDAVNGCWPRGGCKVKDSALATLALTLAGQEVSKETDWLKKARVPGLSGGEWWIVVKANSNGTCQFSYANNNSKTFKIEGDKVKLPSGGFTSGQYHINLNELSSSLRNSLQPQINIACDSTLASPIMTLIYKPTTPVNTFFIQRSDPGSNVQFKVANACFGTQVPASSCNYESTAYATWALVEAGAVTTDSSLSLENIGTHIYLESQALNKKNDPIALGLLNRILIRSSSAAPSFISDLVKLQRSSDGSWNGDVIATAIADFGLIGSDQSEAISRATNYLTTKVSTDGSWNGNIEETSWALIALHGGTLNRNIIGGGNVAVGNNEVCGNGFDDDSDGAIDCSESECVSEAGCICADGIQDGDETGVDCGGSCQTICFEEEPQEEQPTEETLEEEPFPEDEIIEEEGGSLWWLWLLIILIIGGGVFFYVKYVKTGKVDLAHLFKKKPKGPTFDEFRRQAEFKPVQPQKPAGGQPARPTQQLRATAPARPMKNKEEDELERSIREAQ